MPSNCSESKIKTITFLQFLFYSRNTMSGVDFVTILVGLYGKAEKEGKNQTVNISKGIVADKRHRRFLDKVEVSI